MKTFTKWIIINCLVLTASFFASQKGLFNLVISTDISYISLISMILFAGFSVFCGKLSKDADNLMNNNVISKELEICKFASDNFTVFGLLGTLIGMGVMMYNTLGGGSDVNSIIQQLKIGSSTAFYTSIVGIICNFLLNLQILVIENKLKDNE